MQCWIIRFAAIELSSVLYPLHFYFRISGSGNETVLHAGYHGCYNHNDYTGSAAHSGSFLRSASDENNVTEEEMATEKDQKLHAAIQEIEENMKNMRKQEQYYLAISTAFLIYTLTVIDKTCNIIL